MANVLLADPTSSVAAKTLESTVIARGTKAREYSPLPEHMPPNTPTDFWVYVMRVRVMWSFKLER
jgi:hypothetical protein